MKQLLVLAFLLITLGLSACQETCYEQTTEYRTEVESVVDDWQDAVTIANSTSRISLSTPVSRLQEIQNDTEDMEVPECAQTAHGLLVQHMDDVIKAFILFMGDADDEAGVTAQFNIANTRLEAFLGEFEKLKDPEN